MHLHYGKVWIALVLGLCLSVWAGAASAWDFKLLGAFNWNYVQLSQSGPNGFFGRYDIDNGAAGTVGGGNGSSLNFWGGDQAAGPIGMVSGSNATWNAMYMTMDPEITITPALWVKGRYRIGSWGTFLPYDTVGNGAGQVNTAVYQGSPVYSEYFSHRFEGVQRSFAPGEWTLLSLHAKVPWGHVSLGKRRSIFGTGLMWDGEENRSNEGFNIATDWGPLHVRMTIFPSRKGTEANTETNVDGYYNPNFDANNKRSIDYNITTVYHTGPMEMGGLVNWVRRHRGPERALISPTAKLSERSRDRMQCYGGIYGKYNNGRFFANSEMDWFDQIDRYSQGGIGAAGRSSFNNPFYQSHWRAMTETGLFSGPLKLSFLVSWSSGSDRRNGYIRGVNQGTQTDTVTAGTTSPNPRVQSTNYSNTIVYRPYQYLMVGTYGLGTHVNYDTGWGYVEEAFCKGARLDYAVAANLNVFATFFQANRVGNGHGWGYLKPVANVVNATNGIVLQTIAQSAGAVSGAYRGGVGTPASVAPTIPDDDLGYEIGGGLSWKLIEGFILNGNLAYWHVGNWFKFACIDKANPAWTTQNGTPNGGAARWGTNPSREIDPVIGARINLIGEF